MTTDLRTEECVNCLFLNLSAATCCDAGNKSRRNPRTGAAWCGEWRPKEERRKRARRVLPSEDKDTFVFMGGQTVIIGTYICPSCHSRNDIAFDDCQHCGVSRLP